MPALEYEDSTHTYSIEGRRVPSVTQVIDWLDPWHQTPEGIAAGARGTIAHAACHLSDAGDWNPDGMDVEWLGYVEGWQRFLRESGYIVIDSECVAYSEQLQFAGRADRVGDLNTKPTLVDIKSGGARACHKLQTAAYQAAFRTRKPLQRACVYLRADGSYSLVMHKDPNDIYDFLAALRCVRWRERNT